MTTDHDWKKQFANDAERAILHPLTQENIDELLFNLRSDRNGLPYYGILKLCNVVAQVARADAMGIDPELLRLSADEVNEWLGKMIEAFADAGKPVIVVDGSAVGDDE
jgi:hypothetical protein